LKATQSDAGKALGEEAGSEKNGGTNVQKTESSSNTADRIICRGPDRPVKSGGKRSYEQKKNNGTEKKME